MKFTQSSLIVGLWFIGTTTMSMAIAVPNPTPLPEMKMKKRLPSDGSALLGNPSSALNELSILLQNPTISSQFKSIATQSVYQSKLSSEYAQQFGTQTASELLESYNGLISSIISDGNYNPSEYSTTTTTRDKSNYDNSASSILASTNMMGIGFLAGAVLVLTIM